jgi:hypothetical protein
MQLLRMIGTIAGTAGTITVIVRVHRSNSSRAYKIKRGSRAAPPFCHFAVSSTKRANCTYVS